jgi:DNA polymerase-3 subunit epsilon
MAVREIVFDTETTGLDPKDGHRVVEIGCLELIDRVWTGGKFHTYINPDRSMPEEAFRIHGISDEKLATEPRFAEVAAGFVDFVGDSVLVAHNASFDMRFVNWELQNAGFQPLPTDRVVDTLAIARKRFPGAGNSLDALCRRFEVDTTDRTLHGALIDSRLLADVYYHLMGAKQAGLELQASGTAGAAGAERPYREPRIHAASESDLTAHRAFLDEFVKEAVWDRR